MLPWTILPKLFWGKVLHIFCAGICSPFCLVIEESNAALSWFQQQKTPDKKTNKKINIPLSKWISFFKKKKQNKTFFSLPHSPFLNIHSGYVLLWISVLWHAFELSGQSAPSYPCMLPPSPSAPQSFEPSSYPSPHLPGPPTGNTSTGKIPPTITYSCQKQYLIYYFPLSTINQL